MSSSYFILKENTFYQRTTPNLRNNSKKSAWLNASSVFYRVDGFVLIATAFLLAPLSKKNKSILRSQTSSWVPAVYQMIKPDFSGTPFLGKAESSLLIDRIGVSIHLKRGNEKENDHRISGRGKSSILDVYDHRRRMTQCNFGC